MNHVADQKANRHLTYVLYLFYIISVFTGNLLAVIALVLNHVKRKAVRNSLLESHFSWQIRTFWWGCLWNILTVGILALALFNRELGVQLSDDHASLLFFTGLACVFTVGAWTVYRNLHGLFCLYGNKPMYD